jgi:superfamily II DNA or RNA helicase
MSVVNAAKQSGFVATYLREYPAATLVDVQAAWRAAGNSAILAPNVFWEVKRARDKTSPVAAALPEPTRYMSRSEFIRQCLAKKPSATLKEINDAWHAAGQTAQITPTLLYAIKSKMRKLEEEDDSDDEFDEDDFGDDDFDEDTDDDFDDDFDDAFDSWVRQPQTRRSRLKRVKKVVDLFAECLVCGSDTPSVWLAAVQALIERHHREGITRPAVGKVAPFEWDEIDEVLLTTVGWCRVAIGIPIDASHEEFWAECECEIGLEDRLCAHSLSAAQQLLEQLFREAPSLPAPAPAAPDWRGLLDRLSSFIEKTTKTPEQPDRRLVWIIEDLPGASAIELFEQHLNKKGKWTRGRRIYGDRYKRALFPWARQHDQKVLAAFEGYYDSYYGDNWSWRSSDERTTIADVLRTMIGHPHVYWAEDRSRPVQIRSLPLTIAVEPAGDGAYRLRSVLDGRPIKALPTTIVNQQSAHVVFDRPGYCVTIVEGAGESLRLALEVGNWDAVIPASELEKLLAVLNRLESVIPVALPPELEGTEQPADAQVTARLTPLKPQGIELALVVRPTDQAGAFAPGEGTEKLTTIDGGKKSTLVRQFPDERKHADHVAQQLPLDDAARLGPWHWKLDSDDRALDLIDAIQSAKSAADDRPVRVEWPQGESMSVVGTVQPKELRVRIVDRRDWFGLSGSIDVGGHQVSLADLLSSIRHDREYVPIGAGKWAKIANAFRDRLVALRDVSHSERSGLSIGRTALPVVCDLEDDSVSIQTCVAWRRIIERLDALDETKPIPSTFQAELRDYQTQGVHWLRRLAAWGVGACLADDMGLGKTVEALAVLVERAELGPALVVAPTSVGFNWVSETQRFAPTLRPVLYRETDRAELLADLKPGDLLITSYGLLRRDVDVLAKQKWGTLLVDEAQFLKNSQTQTAKAARQIQAEWTVALTGTPLENHLGELWSIFRVLSPGLFGSWDRFKQQFADPIERRRDHERRQALARLIRPFVLRRTKAQVLTELPSRTEDVRIAELSAKERRLYENERLRALVELADASKGEDQRFKVLAALTRLRQLACHPQLVDASWTGGSAKFEMFLELIDEIKEAGHRALVFSQFVQHLTLVRKALDERNISYQYLDGQTPAAQRKARVEAFQRGDGELFLISLKAGGTGLNLTAADYVIHLDPWWNPAVEDQATDRAHRIGQTRPVSVYRLVAKDTIEEQILALHADKRDLVAGVLDGADQAARLSTNELISLIRAGTTA